MKMILSEDFAIIEANDVRIIDHPTMIFTDDWVKVNRFKDFEKTVDHFPKIKKELFAEMPKDQDKIELGKCYLQGGKIKVTIKDRVYDEVAKPWEPAALNDKTT